MIIRGACNTKEQQRLIKDSPNLKDIITDIVDKETLDAIKNSASKSFDLFDMPDCKKGLQDQYIRDAFCSIKIKNLGLDSEWQFAKNVLNAIDKDSLQSLRRGGCTVYEDSTDLVSKV